MTDEELLQRIQRRRSGEGRSCRAPEDPLHTMGSVQTLLVDLPAEYTWSDASLKSGLDDYVGGLAVLDTVREERVVAQKPYERWAFCCSAHVVQFNSLRDLGEVSELASRLAERQVGKEGRPLSAKVLAASRGSLGVAPADTIEYVVETAQGPLHVVSLSCALDGRLYNVTAQVPESQWPELGKATKDTLATTRLCSKVSKFFAGIAAG